MRLKTYVGIIAGLVLATAIVYMSWPIEVSLRLRGSDPVTYITTWCGNGWSMDEYFGSDLAGYDQTCGAEITVRRILSWPAIVVSTVVLAGVLLVGRKFRLPAAFRA
jgi:hypothetical protein